MITAYYKKFTLRFRIPAGTSRGILITKDTYFILLSDTNRPGIVGAGECSILKGLSPDDRPDLEEKLNELCKDFNTTWDNREETLREWPAIHAGAEMAMLDLNNGGSRVLFPSGFTNGTTSIPVNGLVWMGTPGFMQRQIDEKLASGFKVLKMKIGAIDFEKELNLIQYIRKRAPMDGIEIRLDANGAFSPKEALEKLKKLSDFNIHSVEQPIQRGQTEAMAELCRKSPVPLALDEELIGIAGVADKLNLLQAIMPQYIILKPSLLGGFESAGEWIEAAEKVGAGWWITSALESNIGLNAIAQWTSTLKNPLVQGLGTGSLFTNNIPSPLRVSNGELIYDHTLAWDLSSIL